jgi:hypothetical protein
MQQFVATNKKFKEDKIMTKTNVQEILKGMKISYNEETKHYEVTEAKLNKVYENEELAESVKFAKSKNNENLIAIRGGKDFKTTYAILEIKKMKKEKSSEDVGKYGHKGKGSSYIILLKNKDDKKETRITDIDNCADIKKFLKTVSKKQLEYLKIYDNNNNEVRKSAWVG